MKKNQNGRGNHLKSNNRLNQKQIVDTKSQSSISVQNKKLANIPHINEDAMKVLMEHVAGEKTGMPIPLDSLLQQKDSKAENRFTKKGNQ